MKKRQCLFVLLVLTALLLSGCVGTESSNTFDQLVVKASRSAEKAYKERRDRLTDSSGAEIIDFTALQKTNPELYAWLYIPGTEINTPIAQSESGDISFYQSHSADRSEDQRGCLYTHFRYSDKHFSEPVSIIYGKTLSGIGVLSGIEAHYHSREGLQQHQELVVFTADAVLRYRVFCATEFSDALISRDYNEFQTEADTAAFLEDIRNYHTLQRQADDSVSVSSGDRLLVLSTILSRDADKRFLVVAKLVDSTN